MRTADALEEYPMPIGCHLPSVAREELVALKDESACQVGRQFLETLDAIFVVPVRLIVRDFSHTDLLVIDVQRFLARLDILDEGRAAFLSAGAGRRVEL